MKNLAKKLVYSNLWVGLAVVCFTFITMLNQPRIHYFFLAFIGCSTVFVYNYMRLVQIRALDLRHDFSFKAWLVGNRKYVWVLVLIFGALSFFFFLKIYTVQLAWILCIPALISILYPLSFKRAFSGFTSLRTVPGLKMFLIAVTWSYVTVFIPVFLYGRLELHDIIELAMRTVLVLGLVVPFDIRDVTYDEPGMKTIPQVLGAEKARQLAMFFVILYQIWLIIQYFFFGLPLSLVIANFIGLEIGYWLIRYSHRKHSEQYFSFWIEGVPIYCALLATMMGMLLL